MVQFGFWSESESGGEPGVEVGVCSEPGVGKFFTDSALQVQKILDGLLWIIFDKDKEQLLTGSRKWQSEVGHISKFSRSWRKFVQSLREKWM